MVNKIWDWQKKPIINLKFLCLSFSLLYSDTLHIHSHALMHLFILLDSLTMPWIELNIRGDSHDFIVLNSVKINHKFPLKSIWQQARYSRYCRRLSHSLLPMIFVRQHHHTSFDILCRVHDVKGALFSGWPGDLTWPILGNLCALLLSLFEVIACSLFAKLSRSIIMFY